MEKEKKFVLGDMYLAPASHTREFSIADDGHRDRRN